MDNATLFYVVGAVLAVSAVAFSFAGLRFEGFPGRLTPLVVLWFVVLVGGATTFGVLNGKDEQEARASELAKAGEEAEEVEGRASAEEAGGPEGENQGGEGGTLKLAADPSEIAFDTTTLTSKPGKVTIDFDNPATLEHNVAIEQGGKQLAISDTIAQGKTSVTADLAPGSYTFLCTVPGHAEAGMEGALTVR
jgi:plastocyanin